MNILVELCGVYKQDMIVTFLGGQTLSQQFVCLCTESCGYSRQRFGKTSLLFAYIFH